MSNANPPCNSGCSASNALIAMGIEAADVLPEVRISLAITTFSGNFISRAMDSMIRTLAWCGIKASSWSGETPAASRARSPALLIEKTAHRKTVWPCWEIYGQAPSDPPCQSAFHEGSNRMASRESASDPQTMGPIPGSSEGPMTTAPAPSAKMKAVARS